MSESRQRWLEVNLGAVQSNVEHIRRFIGPGVGLMVVVKANAYGHGLAEIAHEACRCGVDYLAVSDVEEGVRLRETGIRCPVVVLGPTMSQFAAELLAYDLTQSICTMDVAAEISRQACARGQNARVHVNVDTGIQRLGVSVSQARRFLAKVASLPGLTLEGIFTHFAEAGKPDSRFAAQQLAVFARLLQELEDVGITVPVRHAANSAAVFHLPPAHLDVVRPGIAVYGVHPTRKSQEMVQLRQVMSLKTRIARLRAVGKGCGISYERQYVTRRKSMIATLPVGYADGYPCSLSNTAQVLIHGFRAPVIGTVCMDMTLVDVSHIPQVAVGDEVVLFGHQGQAFIGINEVAAWAGTISYEIMCGIRSRVPRCFLRA